MKNIKNKKITTPIIIERCKQVHGDKYDYSLTEYTRWNEKIKIICRIHGEFFQEYHSHLSGKGCFKCGLNVITYENFINRAVALHGDKYDYSRVKIVGSNVKTTIICKEHGPWEQMVGNHLAGHGCEKCAGVSKISKEDFILRARKIHGDKYDYSKSIINGLKNRITVVCKIHGPFVKIISEYLKGTGCPKCSKIKRHRTNQDFIDEANLKHNFKYDYSKTNFTKTTEKIIVICKDHGEFEQIANSHLVGNGCFYCAIKGTSSCTEEFIKKAEVIHNFKYDYSNVVYTNSITKVNIVCPKHGKFFQKPNAHLNGSGCPNCYGHISKPETAWLDFLNIQKENRNFRIEHNNKKYFVDGFEPLTNTVYEFNGDYWHGNPAFYKQDDLNKDAQKTYGELYQKTLEKEAWLKFHGYNIVSIWESDWNTQVKANKLKASNAI